jgi:hypothetical protein
VGVNMGSIRHALWRDAPTPTSPTAGGGAVILGRAPAQVSVSYATPSLAAPFTGASLCRSRRPRCALHGRARSPLKPASPPPPFATPSALRSVLCALCPVPYALRPVPFAFNTAARRPGRGTSPSGRG